MVIDIICYVHTDFSFLALPLRGPGGPVALEEALCLQSTLHLSLRRAAKLAELQGIEPWQPWVVGIDGNWSTGHEKYHG